MYCTTVPTLLPLHCWCSGLHSHQWVLTLVVLLFMSLYYCSVNGRLLVSDWLSSHSQAQPVDRRETLMISNSLHHLFHTWLFQVWLVESTRESWEHCGHMFPLLSLIMSKQRVQFNTEHDLKMRMRSLCEFIWIIYNIYILTLTLDVQLCSPDVCAQQQRN